MEGEIVLSVTIHDTPAAIRMGGDGYLITFAGTEQDKEKAAQLILMLKMELELVVRPKLGKHDGKQNESAGESEAKGAAKGKGRRPWLDKSARAKADG